MKNPTYIIYARHASRFRTDMPGRLQSRAYGQFTSKGVRIVQRNLAASIIKLIKDCPQGTVAILCGCDRETRTEETLKIIARELHKKFGADKDFICLNLNKCLSWLDVNYSKKIKILSDFKRRLDDNKNKKVIMFYPRKMAHWSRYPDFYYRVGKKTAYQRLLFAMTGYTDKDSAVWIKGNGKLKEKNKIIHGPNPQQTGEKMLKGISYLLSSMKKLSGPRPLCLVCIGHGKKLDAFSIYLANKGKINYAGYTKLGGDKINSAEMGLIKNTFEGTEFFYRRRRYKIPPKIAKKIFN